MFFSGIFSSNISYVIMFMGLLYYGLQTITFGVNKIHHILVREKEADQKEIYAKEQGSTYVKKGHDFFFIKYQKNKPVRKSWQYVLDKYPKKNVRSARRYFFSEDSGPYYEHKIRPFQNRAPPTV